MRGQGPTLSGQWQPSVRCGRIHLHVKVDYTIRFEQAPCPSAEHPLHHLVRSEFQEPLERNLWKRQNPTSKDEIFTYKCSSSTCSATVTVRLSPPILTKEHVHILTDSDLLGQRTEDAFRRQGGQTEGMKYPTATDVLCDLRSYIKNSWKANAEAKFGSIKLTNKRFIVRFGPDGAACQQVLEHLGFQLDPANAWKVPEPNYEESEPFQDEANVFLDNVEHEIVSLIAARPYVEREQIQDIPQPASAEKELARVLGCQDYDTHPSSRTVKLSPEMRTGPFIALGCPSDLADELIISAYHWQVQTDPHHAPTYLSNLRYITDQRQSDLLETEVVLETSQGRFDVETLNNAYKAFQLTGREAFINDEDVIGSFVATLADSPAHEHELREYLRIIGVHRNSKRIINTAQNGERVPKHPVLTLTDWLQSLRHTNRLSHF